MAFTMDELLWAAHAWFNGTKDVSVKASNGATLDDWRNNIEGVLLASAARTATVAGANQTNYNGRGVTLILDVTIAPGTTDTVKIQLQAQLPGSVKWVDLAESATLTAAGVVTLQVGPALADAVGTFATKGRLLPRTWRANVVETGTGSFTYSLGFGISV